MTQVVRIIARMNVGGPARHVVLLGKGLRAHGFETTLLAGDLDEGEIPLELPMEGLRRLHVPGLGRPPSPKDDLRALASIVRILRRERPDVVHTHTAKAGALGRLAARIVGVPVVVHTFHGHVLSGYFSPLGSRLVTLAEQALSTITARIVTLSPGLRDELAGTYRVAPRERFEVVPLGRDLRPFQEAEPGALRRELGLGPEAFLVGGVGRLVPIKRVPLLVDGFARLASRNPRAHLVLVGDGTERGAVEAAASAQGLSHRVHLLGWRTDLPRIYADLDLLALSSRNEGTPLAMVEAFAAGVPVVATAVGGVPDMFVDDTPGRLAATEVPRGVTLRPQGALVPSGDAEALGAALGLFSERAALRAAAGEAAQRASLRYSAERLIEETAALYRRLLQERVQSRT